MAAASEPARSRQAWHNLALRVSATGDVAIAVANRTVTLTIHHDVPLCSSASPGRHASPSH